MAGLFFVCWQVPITGCSSCNFVQPQGYHRLVTWFVMSWDVTITGCSECSFVLACEHYTLMKQGCFAYPCKWCPWACWCTGGIYGGAGKYFRSACAGSHGTGVLMPYTPGMEPRTSVFGPPNGPLLGAAARSGVRTADTPSLEVCSCSSRLTSSIISASWITLTRPQFL